MSREMRFLLCGAFAGLLLGVLLSFAIQRGQQSGRRVTETRARNPRGEMPKNDIAGASQPTANVETRGVATQSEESIAIQLIPTVSFGFSTAFVQAVREMKAAGESPDVLVNLVVAEFTRQWRDQMKQLNRKASAGEIDNEQRQEFFSGRQDAIGKAVAEILGQDGFIHWDKQRLLMKAHAQDYKLTAAESDALYQIEKEHEDRNLELNALLSDGEIDPLTCDEQRRKCEEQYQRDRSKFVTEDRR